MHMAHRLIGMKILKFTEKAFYEQIVLQSAKSSRFLRSLTNGIHTEFLNEPTKSFHSFYLALFRQENSDFENEFIEENILEVLFVQYLPESNCGFVRFLCLKYGGSQSENNSLNFDWGKRLIEEAESNLNKEAQRNGFQRVHEIFYHIATAFSPTTSCYFNCLYNIGFYRMLETANFSWEKLKPNNFSHLLVYRPHLVPDFSDENGTLRDEIKTSNVVKFLKEFLNEYMESAELDANKVEEWLGLITRLENGTSEVFVRSAFPWHGSTASCPDNQVAVVGGGVAGLAAASSLSEAGFEVILLEAADYFGGRVKQAQPFKGFAPVDLGGEFIHGSDSIITRIARENGWPVLPCHGCEELETEDMIYYKGKLHPLLSDHPDISEAWKAWDEIIFLSQKETNNDILQTSISSENKRDTFLHKGGVETRAEKDFADTMTAGCKTQRTGINDSSKGECDSTSTKETEFDSNSTENVADTVATEHKTQDGDMSILEWLKRRECGEGVIGVFEAIYCQTVAAAPSQMGLLESSREENAWDYGSGNYRLAGSYSQLVEYLLNKCSKVDLRLKWQVKEINWKGNLGQISGDRQDRASPGEYVVLKNQRGEMLTAKYAVITVPLTVLKDGDINFVPALPENKKKAIDRIQMKGALKIVCRFKSQFWSDKVNLIYCVRGFVSQIWMYTRDSSDSEEKCHVIAGFQTAEPAEQKMNLSEKDVLDGFLQQLDEIFGTESHPNPATDLLMDYVYYHWSKHPFIRGAYSSPTVHAQGMRHLLASPLQDRLFFAGEATNVTACACVHTAMETGTRAAHEVCRVDKHVQTEF